MTGLVDHWPVLGNNKWKRLSTVIIVCCCGYFLGLACTCQVLALSVLRELMAVTPMPPFFGCLSLLKGRSVCDRALFCFGRLLLCVSSS